MYYKDYSFKNKIEIDDKLTACISRYYRNYNSISVEEYDIDPSIFLHIENVLSNNNYEELIKMLEDFEILSAHIALRYIQTFHVTTVPSKLVELLDCQNPIICDIVSRIICSLITPDTPEYADDLCENGFLFQCGYMLDKQLFNSSTIYYIFTSLSLLASFSSAKCDLILSNISVDMLSIYAQSKILDSDSYIALLRLLIFLSKNNVDELITNQLIELAHSIFSDCINSSKQICYYFLQLTYLLSKYPQFFESFFVDKSTTQLLKFLSTNEKDCILIYSIKIMINILKYTNVNFDEQLVQISNLILSGKPNIVKYCSQFIRIYFKKNASVSENVKIHFINLLFQIFDSYCTKEKFEILYCIFDIISLVLRDTLLQHINLSVLFGMFFDALDSEIDDIVIYALQSLNDLFSKDENCDHQIIDQFIENEGINYLTELISKPNHDNPQIAYMAQMLVDHLCKHLD